jgi:hypothetical protein
MSVSAHAKAWSVSNPVSNLPVENQQIVVKVRELKDATSNISLLKRTCIHLPLGNHLNSG